MENYPVGETKEELLHLELIVFIGHNKNAKVASVAREVSLFQLLPCPEDFDCFTFLGLNHSLDASYPWVFFSSFHNRYRLFKSIKHLHQLVFGLLGLLLFGPQLLSDSFDVDQPPFSNRERLKCRQIIYWVFEVDITHFKLGKSIKSIKRPIFAPQKAVVLTIIEILVQQIHYLPCGKCRV